MSDRCKRIQSLASATVAAVLLIVADSLLLVAGGCRMKPLLQANPRLPAVTEHAQRYLVHCTLSGPCTGDGLLLLVTVQAGTAACCFRRTCASCQGQAQQDKSCLHCHFVLCKRPAGVSWRPASTAWGHVSQPRAQHKYYAPTTSAQDVIKSNNDRSLKAVCFVS
jgi:hypothetical protein